MPSKDFFSGDMEIATEKIKAALADEKKKYIHERSLTKDVMTSIRDLCIMWITT